MLLEDCWSWTSLLGSTGVCRLVCSHGKTVEVQKETEPCKCIFGFCPVIADVTSAYIPCTTITLSDKYYTMTLLHMDGMITGWRLSKLTDHRVR